MRFLSERKRHSVEVETGSDDGHHGKSCLKMIHGQRRPRSACAVAMTDK